MSNTIYEFLLPLADNRGFSTGSAILKFGEDALDLAGGWTKGPIHQGAWKDPASGRVYRDNVIPMSVAATPAQANALSRAFFRLFPDQEALAIRAHGKLTITHRLSLVAVA